MFLEIWQNSQENICARVSFLIKLQTWIPLGDCFWQNVVFSLCEHSLFYGQKLLTSSDWNWGNFSIEFNNKHGLIKQPFTFVLQNRCWKQLRSGTLIKKTPVQVLSCEFCEIFKNPFWQNSSGWLLLDFFIQFTVFCHPVN